MQLWLRPEGLESYAHDDPIDTWYDSSPEGADAFQITSSKRPKCKHAVLAGHSVANFDGGDTLVVPTFPVDHFCIFAVWRAQNAGTYKLVYEYSADTNSGNGFYLQAYNDATIAVKKGGQLSARDMPSSTWASDNTWRLTRHEYGGSHDTHRLKINGVAAEDLGMYSVSGNNPASGTMNDNMYLFSRNEGSLFVTGELAEIIVYDNVPSAEDIGKIEEYFAAKYSL